MLKNYKTGGRALTPAHQRQPSQTFPLSKQFSTMLQLAIQGGVCQSLILLPAASPRRRLGKAATRFAARRRACQMVRIDNPLVIFGARLSKVLPWPPLRGWSLHSEPEDSRMSGKLSSFVASAESRAAIRRVVARPRGLHTSVMALAISAALVGAVVFAQEPFASSTPMPTPTAPGGTASKAPVAEATRGPGSPGVIAVHAPEIIFHVGGESVFPPSNECSGAILHALKSHAPVLIPPSGKPAVDQRCTEEMDRALYFERTRSECANGPCW